MDYGSGNLFSLQNALAKCGFSSIISSDKNDIKNASHLILPGVGAFKNGMKGLKSKNLISTIIEFANSGRPILGICLGMQLLSTKSFEFGVSNGLNIIPGKVDLLPQKSIFNKKVKIPNIGWVSLKKSFENKFSILSNISQSEEVYLIHSFFYIPKNIKNILATCDFHGHSICIAINKNNIFGTQFHPEKSGEVGIRILNNFCNLIYD